MTSSTTGTGSEGKAIGYDIVYRYHDPNVVSASFRFTVWDMEKYRDYMLERGMLVEAPTPQVVTGLTVEDGTLGPIPEYKLCSNDGWLITPLEIRRALNARTLWEIRQRTVYGNDWMDPLIENDPLWASWVAFLELAQVHGGAVVW